MLLRCIIQKKDSQFVGTVLELGIAEQAETLQQLRERLEEAVNCYFHAVAECGERCDENMALNPVPFYWLKKIWFEVNWRSSVKSSRSEDATIWEEENYQLRMASA